MNNLRSTVATKILANIPPRVKPIDYLMETLNISRESVYRRIRGDISFTLEEISKLSIDLGFSIDDLIMEDMPARVFFDLHIDAAQNPSDIFLTIMQQHFKGIYDQSYVKDVDSTVILNHLMPGFVIPFNHLFKFAYYRWMHQHQESSLNYYYSDVSLPEKLIGLQQKAIESLRKLQHSSFIFDADIFINLFREIRYYYKRRLLSENEFTLLKNDLLGYVNMVENIAQTGHYGSGTKFQLYLSMLNIESTSRYIKYDGRSKSQFFVNSIEPVTISNPNICAIHKKWLDSMRKYATLITQSNEILQVRYFNKQRAQIEEMSDIHAGMSIEV